MHALHESPIVLVVDDDQDTAAMYTIGLLAMGFQPVAAATIDEGLSRAARVKPDVIVADVCGAGITALDITHRIRRDARTRDTGIIVLTGSALGGINARAEAAGCDRVLVKPCLPDVLALEIRSVLHEREMFPPSVV